MEWTKHLDDSTTEGRITAIDRFLTEWYGPWSPEYRLRSEDELGALPRALAWWYSTHAARPSVISYNHLMPPRHGGGYIRGRRIFLSENQGVYVWAHGLDSDDPPVWVRLNQKEGRWMKEGERLSGFLLQLLLWEAEGRVHTSANWIDRPSYLRLTSALERLPLSPWHWPGWKTEFFARDDLIAVGYPDEGRRHHVYIKAHSTTLIETLRPIISDDHWDNP